MSKKLPIFLLWTNVSKIYTHITEFAEQEQLIFKKWYLLTLIISLRQVKLNAQLEYVENAKKICVSKSKK